MNVKSIFYTYALLLAVLNFTSCSKDDPEVAPDIDTPGEEYEFEGTVAWSKTYGGRNEDNALSVVETTDGGYAIAGYTLSADGDITDKTATDSDYWLLKLDKEGGIIWSKTYGGTNDDRAEKLIQTTDGGFVIVGYSRSADEDSSENAGLQDYWVIKVNNLGELQWEKSFGFAGIDRAFSIIQTNDGGYFVTGFLDVTASDGEGNDNARVAGTEHGVGEFWGIKLDASGNKEWRRYFGGSNNDRSYDVVQTEDGGFLMIGSSESIDFDITDSKGSYDFWAIKVDAKGEMVWQRSYGGSEIDVAYALAATGDGEYLIIGDVRSNDGDISEAKGNADLWMVKIDGRGEMLWEKSLGGSEFDTGRGIYKMQNGGFVITGNSRSSDFDVDENKGSSDLWNIIVDAKGEVVWHSTFGGSASEFGFGCIETSDNRVVIVGSSESSDLDVQNNQGSKDAIVVKYN